MIQNNTTQNTNFLKKMDEDSDYAIDALTPIELKIVGFFLSPRGAPQTVRDLRNKLIWLYLKEYEKDLPEDFMTTCALTQTLMPPTKFGLWLEKRLKKKIPSIDIPSYRKIETNLMNLKEMNLVLMREDTRQNVTGLWILNPEFRKKWNVRRKAIIEELKKERDIAIRQKIYDQRVYDFYNIPLLEINLL